MIKAALIGYQSKARAFYNIFKKNEIELEKITAEKIEIKYIYCSQEVNSAALKHLKRKGLFCPDFNNILEDPEIDLVIELSEEEDSALDYIVKSLKKAKTVITASKKAVAENLLEIKAVKEKYKTEIFFGAALAPLPVLKNIEDFFLLDKIIEIDAVLNGSSNYILSLMEAETISMKETIKKVKNYSREINSEADLEGFDSLYKISIIADLAFNTAVDPSQIKVKGIKGITSYDIIYAEELGFKIKLLAAVLRENNKILIGVRPVLIRTEEFLAAVEAKCNGLEIKSELTQKTAFKASTEGKQTLLNCLNSDLISAFKFIKSKKNKDFSFGQKFDYSNQQEVVDLYSTQKNSFYIRLQLEKDDSNLEEIKEIFSEKDLAELILHDNLTETPLLPLIIITKDIKEKRLEAILKQVEELDGVLTVNNIIPVKK